LLAAAPADLPAQEAGELPGGPGPSSGRDKPLEIYVSPRIPWRGPLPEVDLRQAGACELRGEPLWGPVWSGEAALAVLTEDPETSQRWLSLCRLGESRPAWSVPIGAAPAGAPAADAATVYVVSEGGEVRAYDARGGSLRWANAEAAPAGTGIWRLPDAVLIGSTASLVALDPASGTRRFSIDAPGGVVPPVLDCGGRWIVSLRAGRLRAHDPAGGAILWDRSLPGIPSSPACREGEVLVGTSQRRLLALSLARGRRAWTQRLGGAVEAPPVPYESGVYAGALDGRVYGFKSGNGHRLWAVPVGERVRRVPARIGGLLIVASAGDTRLSVLHLPTGGFLLQAEAPVEAAGWVGEPAVQRELLALAADRRASPDGLVAIYRVAESPGAAATGR
jgi:outer membrane protein assembly factor BamB